jgi:hypothetical protein
VEKLIFEVYTRKLEFLPTGTPFEEAYLLPNHAPHGFSRYEWDYRGFVEVSKSATLSEVKKVPLQRLAVHH